MTERYDVIVVGAGTSGLNLARELAAGGLHCLVLEAGGRYDRHTYPRTEVDGSAQLFWGGGLELNADASLAILRPKVVGGGSIVNQALMDRFDDVALDDFRAASGVDLFTETAMAPYYDRAEATICLQTVPERHRNGNATIFAEGFSRNGYRHAPLRRAQSDCRFEDGNSCIECLSGCRIDSKQSTAITALPAAERHGAVLLADVEVTRVAERPDRVSVTGLVGKPGSTRTEQTWTAARLVLAAGAIGNSRLLLSSGFGAELPALGRNFFTHPQYMNFGVFDEPVRAHSGPLQNYKSADPGFRRQGFKLENVFAGPSSIAMLMPGFGAAHLALMRRYDHLGCIEVCVRDTTPGRIRLNRKGAVVIEKRLGAEDLRRRDAGAAAIRNIFLSMGARRLVEGDLGIGLHLMGGCAIGTDPARSVVDPDFTLHGSRRIHAADSSVFPNAPGINPALTIAALSIRAGESILAAARR
ncbi:MULTISPECIES: GMC family oxidoreductase [unclassified Nocardioides]|uniref:GMC family oxidoreductase N-terminal domain-containing protein n=1 Tax=unclassified Nocardioides TaxID=2615069 RepID=UPI0000570836|nr:MULTISPECIES: GMC family oxidoreductase [unclassified Nocardioides]ABL81606.1 glucose-methanol-choline oxidoreductase [Nocardioides sp. JS614]